MTRVAWLVASVLAAAIALLLGVALGRQGTDQARLLGVVADAGGGWVDVVADRQLAEYPKPGTDVWLIDP